MKTAHQFARELLAGPDLPIGLPAIKEYDLDRETLLEPIATMEAGETHDGDPCEILLIDSPLRAPGDQPKRK